MLSRVRRRTVDEIRAGRDRWGSPFADSEDEDDPEEGDEDQTMTSHVHGNEEDIQWDEWVDADTT